MTYSVFMRNRACNDRDAIMFYGLTKDETSTVLRLVLEKSLDLVSAEVSPIAISMGDKEQP